MSKKKIRREKGGQKPRRQFVIYRALRSRLPLHNCTCRILSSSGPHTPKKERKKKRDCATGKTVGDPKS